MRQRFKRMVCDVISTPIRPAIHHTFRSCKFKDVFDDQAAAQRVVDSIIKDGDDNDPEFPLRPYKCDLCFGWHNGHDRRNKTTAAQGQVSQGNASDEVQVRDVSIRHEGRPGLGIERLGPHLVTGESNLPPSSAEGQA